MIIKDDVTRLMLRDLDLVSLSLFDSSRFPSFIVLRAFISTFDFGTREIGLNWFSQQNRIGTVYQFFDFDDEGNYLRFKSKNNVIERKIFFTMFRILDVTFLRFDSFIHFFFFWISRLHNGKFLDLIIISKYHLIDMFR